MDSPMWRKSSYSSRNGNCVEVAGRPGGVWVRDSKNPDGGRLSFGPGAWRDLVAAVKRGEFDLS